MVPETFANLVRKIEKLDMICILNGGQKVFVGLSPPIYDKLLLLMRLVNE